MRKGSPRAAGTGRTGLGCGAAMFVGVVVFVVVAILSAAVFTLSPAGGASLSAPFLPEQPGAVHWDRNSRLNVLLMMSGDGSNTNAFTIASYEPGSRHLTFLSLPSNLWVTIPGVGQSTLSQVYADTNARTTLMLVQSITHVVIPYYVYLSRSALVRLVDTFGGVSISGTGILTRPENRDRLTGRAAADFVARAPSESSRMERSQALLLAIKDAALRPTELFQIPTVINTLGGSIPTNFPYDQMPTLAHAILNLHDADVHRVQLGYANGAVTGYSGDSQHVALGVWKTIRLLSQAEIGDPQPVSGIPTEVLNGAGVAGQAADLARSLRDSGVRVTDYESATSFAHPRTQVLLAPHAGGRLRSAAQAIATLLQVPLVLGTSERPGAPIQVVIGRDFQDPTQQ